MRRPDAKLVDAIIDRRTSVEPQTASKPTIKRETSEELRWKPVSAIAGRAGEEEIETGSPLRQKLDRRETDQEAKTSPASEPAEVKLSTASKAISALINETSVAKRKASTATSTLPIVDPEPPEPRVQTKAASKEVIVKQESGKDNLAIFDFTDSSPADSATNPRTRIADLAKSARNARRHSALPTSSIPDDKKVDKPEGALPAVHKRTGSGNVKSSSTSSLGKSTTASLARGNSVKDKKPTNLPPSGSSFDLKAKMDAGEEDRKLKETTALRAERAASRRKSMLV
jgi:hypothetical protein